MGDRNLLIHKISPMAIILLLSLAFFLFTPAELSSLPEPFIRLDGDSTRVGRSIQPQKSMQWQRQKLEPGIVWMYKSDSLYGAPQYLNLLAMDADTAAARFRLEAADHAGKPHPPEEPVHRLTASGFARIFDPLAVINAGFFSDHPDYVSSGIFKVRGDVLPFMKEEPEELRFVGSSAVGIDREGNWLFFNRVDAAWPSDWPEAHTAVAGAHRLLEDGIIPEPVASESYASRREQRHAGLRHPRTAICLTDGAGSNSGSQASDLRQQPGTGSTGWQSDDEPTAEADSAGSPRPEILILVADGRHDEALGLTLRELAMVLLDLGCVDAVNLDGGGSSTMYLRGRGVVNHPSGNGVFDHEGERAVRTVIMIQ